MNTSENDPYKPEQITPSSKSQASLKHSHKNIASSTSHAISPNANFLKDLVTVNMIINGQRKTFAVDPCVALLDALREHLDLTGTKKGCDHGQCGACTILCDGKRILSCLTLAVMKDGSEITTIEGIAGEDGLHPLQKAFIEHDAFQCGYCTPGQICSAIGLLKEGKARSRADVKELMSGNLCRCGANTNIIDAIMEIKDGGNHE